MENVNGKNSVVRGRVAERSIDLMFVVSLVITVLFVGMIMHYSNNLDYGSNEPQPDGVYMNYISPKDM